MVGRLTAIPSSRMVFQVRGNKRDESGSGQAVINDRHCRCSGDWERVGQCWPVQYCCQVTKGHLYRSEDVLAGLEEDLENAT